MYCIIIYEKIYPFILFVNTLVTCSDCVNMVQHDHGENIQEKKGYKTLFVDWTLDNCVYFRELIIIGAKIMKMLYL